MSYFILERTPLEQLEYHIKKIYFATLGKNLIPFNDIWPHIVSLQIVLAKLHDEWNLLRNSKEDDSHGAEMDNLIDGRLDY